MSKIKHVVISTLVPLGIMGLISLIAYLVCGAGLTASDCYEQYIPFMNAYYDIITGHKSMFYSLSGSMGYDFWAVFAYYLVSPLNFIILLFGKTGIVYAVNLLIILKLALCGGTFSIFLKNRVPSAKCSRIVMFSTMYALCGFMVGYAWNIMWLDGLVIFPLVMMGLDMLMDDDNPRWYWYTFFLALQIIISYFIGYMTCIFILLYFFTYRFKSFGDFWKKLLRIGLSSILAIGISAIILMPSFGGVQSTYISDEKLPTGFYGSYAESLQTLLLGVNPIGIEFNRQYANMFLTTFGLLAAFIYITSGSTKLSDKIRHCILLAILIFSFNFKPANFIWHGLHEQTGIPNRFAFMAVFLMLTMGFAVCTRSKSKVKKSSIRVALGLVVLTVGAIGFFNRKVIIQAGITCVFAMVYAIILALASGKLKFILTQIFVYIEIVITIVIGLFSCSGTVIGDYGKYIDDFNEINSTKEAGYYREKIDETYNPDEIYFESDMQFFEPREMTFEKAKEYCSFMKNMGHLSVVNEGTVYGINSMSLFNTFNNYSQTQFYCGTGATGGTNNVMYFGENPFMDMLLGVRYYYTRYCNVFSDAYEYQKTVGEVEVYRNQYSLSTGYAIPDSMAQSTFEYDDNPFISMNRLCHDITGKDIFAVENVMTGEGTPDNGGLEYIYTVKDSEKELLLQVRMDNLLQYFVYVNDEKVCESTRNQCVIDLGRLEAGDDVRICLIPEREKELSGNVYGAYMDMKELERAYDILSKEQLVIEDCSDAYINGSITLDEKSSVLITIPAAKGWTIYVDGQKTEYSVWKDLFIMLELEGGEHHIEMKYMTPGVETGAIVTAAGLLIFLIALVITLAVSHRQDEQLKN